jgi:hypothetical protein
VAGNAVNRKDEEMQNAKRKMSYRDSMTTARYGNTAAATTNLFPSSFFVLHFAFCILHFYWRD